MLKSARGQSTVEIAVLIAVIVGALLTMQIYIKRGAMGRYRDASDQIGEQFNPHNTVSTFNIQSGATRQEALVTNGQQKSTIQGTETRNRTGTENVQEGLGTETLGLQ